MSVLGIAASSLFNLNSQSIQTQRQKVQQEFQQLGQDLQSGNLSAAQTDFSALQSLVPTNGASLATSAATSTSATSPASNSIQQAFVQLGQDLRSGNLSAAQQDYSNVQNDAQSQGAQAHHHHHHHGSVEQPQNAQNSITQLFSQLGQDLQNSNLSAARQAYASLQPDLSVFTQAPAASGLAVSA